MELESIQIRRRKGKDNLFSDLELLRQEILLAKTCNIEDSDERQRAMLKIASGHKYSPSGLTRMIMVRCFDSGKIRAEDYI